MPNLNQYHNYIDELRLDSFPPTPKPRAFRLSQCDIRSRYFLRIPSTDAEFAIQNMIRILLGKNWPNVQHLRLYYIPAQHPCRSQKILDPTRTHSRLPCGFGPH